MQLSKCVIVLRNLLFWYTNGYMKEKKNIGTNFAGFQKG